MQLNLLPDLTFSRASNRAIFRFLLSNWGRATAPPKKKQKQIRDSIKHAAEE
jgi:hypothetical protein